MATTDHKIRLSAVDKTKSAFRSMQRGLNKVRGSVFNLRAALVTIVSTAAFTKMSRDIDRLAKTSSKLGIPIRELQGLRHAAELSGVETRTLDMAMQRFTRRLSEAQAGTGEAKAALEEMKISLTDSSGVARTQTDVLADVADAMQALPNQADRLRLAFKLFDSEGAALVNMLDNGSKGLRQLTDDFHDLGMAISEEEAAKVEAFNDAMQRLGTLFGNVGRKIAASILPNLQKMIEFLGDKLLGALLAAVRGLDSFFKFMVENFNALSEATGGFIGTLTSPDFSSAIANLEKVRAGFRKAVGPETQLDIKYTDEGVQQLTETLGNAKDGVEKLSIATEEYGLTLREVQRRGVASLEDSLVDLVMGAKSAKDAFKDMARSIISDLVRMQVQKSITAPLFNMINGGGGFSTLPGYTSVGGGGAPSAAMPSFAGGGFTGVGPRSGGTDGKGGFPAILHPNETVVDHSKGQNGGVTVNLNITTGVSQTVRAEIANLMPQIANATKTAVADARMRGGSFSGAMGV